jgi:hypothetical protein
VESAERLHSKTLDALSREILASVLPGFQFLRGVFHRDEPSGVRQVIILDLSTKRRCLYVIVGLNAASIAGAAPRR